MIAGIARIVRDVGVAEDLAQDALVAALEQWPEAGIPNNPGAWLMATAKHRAIDLLRRDSRVERKHAELVPEFEQAMDALPLKGISDPVPSRFGIHLIQVMERRDVVLDNKQLREQARRPDTERTTVARQAIGIAVEHPGQHQHQRKTEDRDQDGPGHHPRRQPQRLEGDLAQLQHDPGHHRVGDGCPHHLAAAQFGPGRGQ